MRTYRAFSQMLQVTQQIQAIADQECNKGKPGVCQQANATCCDSASKLVRVLRHWEAVALPTDEFKISY